MTTIVDRTTSRMLAYLAMPDWGPISYLQAQNPTLSPASTLLCVMQDQENPINLLRNHMSSIPAAKI